VRTKIMDGARTLFREKGYSNVTMRAIGRKVGCSAAAIYRHFRNKREIMQALRHEGFVKMLEAVRQEMTSPDHRRRLVEFGRGYVRFALENPEAFALMYNLAGQGPEEDPDAGEEPVEGFAFFRDTVREAVERGGLEHADPDTLVFTIWSAMHGLACLINCGRLRTVHGAVDEFELVERMLGWIVRTDLA